MAEVAARITALSRDCVLQLHVEVGRVIVDELHHGRIEHWRRRGPRDPWLRKLLSHPDLNVTPTFVCRALGIYDLWLRGEDGLRWSALTASHLRAVLGLPAQAQEDLLDTAAREGWSVRQLEAAARHARPMAAGNRGRPRTPVIVRTVREWRKALEAAEPDVLAVEVIALGDELREAVLADARVVARAAEGLIAVLARNGSAVDADVAAAADGAGAHSAA